ncbi:tumor necrosis factor ligand superfamily member 8 [Tiliqua scincoides]|uniref:tumor necrosis factor ligand superfamily member 8 n=1 Tax=Tiliqua scincoides TaxID=71010 RepID=UPI003462B325
MSFQPEQKRFLQMNGPQEDMSEKNLTRQLNAPIQSYFYVVIASFTLCLLAALGTILVLVLQRTGSTAQCDGHQRNQNQEIILQSVTSEKATAYLQVLKPVNQSQLRWNKEGILYNMWFNNESLTVQLPGLYFVYCHLHFYVRECSDKSRIQSLELLVNNISMKHTTRSLCDPTKSTRNIYEDLFQVLLVELKRGDQIVVRIDPFAYVDVALSPKNNVLGAFKYTGEEWGMPLPSSN